MMQAQIKREGARVRGQIETEVPFLTLLLIAACIAVALLSAFGTDRSALEALFIASPARTPWQEIAAGEIWRLLTPIFLHFGPIHLLFNLLWVWDLGRQIERRDGRWFLAGFVALVGVAANIAQYLASGPAFGGMSGVVYGLLAYIWMRNRRDPRARYVLRRYDVAICIGWYVLCWTGILGPIGNWAHTAGLVGGLVWGHIASAAVRTGDGLRQSPTPISQPKTPQNLQRSPQHAGANSVDEDLPLWLRRSGRRQCGGNPLPQ
jgi:GlpG protein